MSLPSDTPTLSASIRTVIGKQVKQMRLEGSIPAVVYGNHIESSSLTLNERDFAKLYKQTGTTTLVNLVINDQKPIKVLVHKVQYHPVKRVPTHVDFYQVNLKEKLKTEIPLEFTGVSDAVEVEGGTLTIIKDAVEVECLPEALIQHFTIDISSLKTFDDTLHVSDIVVPAGIEILTEGDEMIAQVTPPRSDEELEALDEAPVEDISAVEVETEDGTKAAEEDTEDKKS